jgi:REP element-mobilizing transposase RayT
MTCPRGNQGQKICADDADRKMWLATLEAARRRTGWRIHAWVLLNNHYHLLLETPEPNLVNRVYDVTHYPFCGYDGLIVFFCA